MGQNTPVKTVFWSKLTAVNKILTVGILLWFDLLNE